MGAAARSSTDDGPTDLEPAVGASPEPAIRRRVADTKRTALGVARTVQARIVQRHRVPDEVVVVAGSPRSGTTWLAEVLDHDGAYRLCFEPLERHHRSAEFAGFHRLQYIRPDETDRRLTGPIDRLLAGQVHSRYTDQWDPHPAWRTRNRLLIKCIRANLLVGAFAARRPGVRIVHIVRHPLAVISSRERLPRSDWSTGQEDLDDLLHQPHLIADFLEPHLEIIEQARDPFRRQLVLWCVEQAVALAGAGSATLTVRYESLVHAPLEHLPVVFAHVGRVTPPPDALTSVAGRPSRTSWNGSGFATAPRQHTSSWRTRFDDDQVRITDEVLERFDLRHLVDD